MIPCTPSHESLEINSRSRETGRSTPFPIPPISTDRGAGSITGLGIAYPSLMVPAKRSLLSKVSSRNSCFLIHIIEFLQHIENKQFITLSRSPEFNFLNYGLFPWLDTESLK